MEHLSLAGLQGQARDDAVLELILERPPVNALRNQDYIDLTEAIAGAPDRGVACILLGAQGRLFCAGGDLSATSDAGSSPYLAPLRLLWSIRHSAVPLITRVSGAAAGIGALLALSGDLIVATPDARFLLPEIDTGALGGFRSMADLIPLPLARFLALTGQSLSAASLFDAGVIDRIASAETIEREADALARRVAARRDVIGDTRIWRPRLASL